MATENTNPIETTPKVKAPKRKSRKKADNLSKRGKEAAVKFLIRRGYEVIDRDFHCHAGTAIVIRDEDDTLVFVEVMTRKNAKQGFPAETSSAEKRDKFERIALAFLADYDEVDITVRFDTISIVVLPSERALIRHHLNCLGVC